MTQALKDFHNQIMGLVALIVLVVGFVTCPQERLDHIGSALVYFGTFPAGQAIYGAAAVLLLAVLRWALSRIPAQFRSETTVTVAQTGPVKVPPSKESGSIAPSGLWLIVAVGCAFALLMPHLHGCGAQLTAAQRQSLALETQRCLVNEAAIRDRSGTTAEQDRADLAQERARCDAQRSAISSGGQ